MVSEEKNDDDLIDDDYIDDDDVDDDDEEIEGGIMVLSLN